MNSYKGCGSITREQFLFPETRITARLMIDDNCDDDVIAKKIIDDNLFQFPTEKMIGNIANVCLKRLHGLDDMGLVDSIAHKPVDVAKQICLYAMMKQYRLVWDYMITVIGEKYRQRDFSYGKIDMNVFFMRLQEQNDEVASWADSTVIKMKQVMNKILAENDYIDGPRATKLNTVLICSELENVLKENGDEIALSAFNCFI